MRITEPVQLIVNPYYYYYHYYILLSLNIHFQVKLGQMVPTVLLLYRVGHVADPVYVPDKNFEDWWNDFYFLQAGCPSCHPTISVKALKQTQSTNLTSGMVLYFL